MALLLAFDTATPHLAVVLSEDGRPLAWREDASAQLSHAELLNVFIDAVMREAGRQLAGLDAVAVGIGPGSYTGLRIGLSAAKGLCFALDKPLIGMETLDVLVAEFMRSETKPGEQDLLVPMIDARRMEVYARAYGSTGVAQGPMAPVILDAAWCASVSGQGRTFAFGDGADKAVALWQESPGIVHVPGIRPSVRGLASCASVHYAHKRFSDLAYLVPEYGKPANVAGKRGGS